MPEMSIPARVRADKPRRPHYMAATLSEGISMSLSSAGLDERRRRILFRARRRGLREMDVALGAFTDAQLPHLTEAELDEVEAWLDAPDPEILSWLTGEVAIPPRFDTPLFAKLKAAPTS